MEATRPQARHRRFRKAFTLNEAFREGVPGDILVFMDSDCAGAPHLLRTYAKHASEGDFYLGGAYSLSREFSFQVLDGNPYERTRAVLTEADKERNHRDSTARKVRRRY